MSKNLSLKNLIVLLIFPFLVVVGLLFNYSAHTTPEHGLVDSGFHYINNFITQAFPFSRTLKQMGVAARYNTGETLQDKIFISPKGLIRNFEITDENTDFRHSNTDAISKFNEAVSSEKTSIHTMIIPTASGVLNNNLPTFSTTLNQKTLIENTYNQFAGEVGTINVFNILFENNDKYIYFRTEDSITPLGAYYIYNELISRMLVASDVVPINSYGVSYSNYDFYGSLFEREPFKNVQGDILFYYENGDNLAPIITIDNTKSITVYDSFYEKDKIGLSSYRYPSEGVMSVTTKNASDLSLLIIGDDSTAFFLPFIYNHYGRITFVSINDLSGLSTSIIPENYDQILISVDIDTYMNSDIISTELEGFIQ